MHRLAITNHSTLNGLCILLDVQSIQLNHNILTNEKITSFCLLADIELDSVHQMMNGQLLSIIGKENSRQFLLKNGIKFCPCCIQEKVHHKKLWFLHCYNVCHEHGILLVDRCKHCGESIKMHSLFRGSCSSCDYSLYQSDKTVISPPDFYTKLNQALLCKSPLKFNHLGFYTYSQFLQLAIYSFQLIAGLPDFTGSFNTILRPFYNKKGLQQLNSEMMISLSNVVWMYSDFPINFHKVLDIFSKRERRLIYDRKSAFEKIFDISCYHKIKDTYENYWLQKLDRGEIRRDFSVFKRNTKLLKKRMFIRKEEAKSQYSNVKIMALGVMKKINIVSTSSRRGYLIEEDSFKNYQSFMDEYVNKREAAEILGIKRNSIYLLIESSLLKEFTVETSKIKLLRRDDLNDLLSACQSKGKMVRSLDELVSFNKALINQSVNGLTMSGLITLILGNQIQPMFINKNAGFSSFYFSKQELNRCIDTIKESRRNERGLNREEVMKFLKIGDNRIKQLHITGVLVPSEIIRLKDGRLRYFYCKCEVINYYESRKESK